MILKQKKKFQLFLYVSLLSSLLNKIIGSYNLFPKLRNYLFWIFTNLVTNQMFFWQKNFNTNWSKKIVKIRIHSSEIGCLIRWERYVPILNWILPFFSDQTISMVHTVYKLHTCIHINQTTYMVHSTVGCLKYFFQKRIRN